jgi:K+-sensing histidine kinase KdpD
MDIGLLSAAREMQRPVALARQLALAIETADETLREKLSRQLVRASEDALRQVDDVMRVARLEEGMFELEPIAVRGLCVDVTAEIARVFGVRMKVEYRNRQRLAVANRELLGSLIYNLCSLGVRNSETGIAPRLSVRDISGGVRIGMRDWGPSLPNGLIREMRKGKVENLSVEEMRSGGLGIVVVSRFAEFMGGRLGVTRHQDGMSIFVDLTMSRQMSLC